MGHDALQDKFLQRSRLVEKALEHHNNGAYQTSIPSCWHRSTASSTT
jgi:hypothetical protein